MRRKYENMYHKRKIYSSMKQRPTQKQNDRIVLTQNTEY